MATSTQHEITQALPQALEASDASNGSAGTVSFVEHPAAPLDDESRDAFLSLLDSEDEPNDALRAGAAWFKQQPL